MCGIAGIIMRSGPPDAGALQRAAALLHHRGPDDAGVHLEGRVGLAHTRLSIIDLGGGHQPIHSDDGRYILVANGEIYNYVELRESLIRAGRRFVTESDSEVILHLFAEHGIEGLSDMQGMYAFALYDRLEDRLLLGRDRLGIKPLFVARLPDRLVFSSELKAILPLLPHAPQIHTPALVEFFHNQFNTGRPSIIAGVERLPPGHHLSVDAGHRIEGAAYWSLENIVPWSGTLDEAREAFDSLFTDVLRIHQRSDVPYGLFLSGGLDSGTLLGTLAPRTGYRLRTYSVGFDGVKGDEAEAAGSIAGVFDTEHETLRVSLDDLRGRIVQSTWVCDDLMRDYAVLPTLALSEVAARDLKVVFTGEGGDEVFAGYDRYRKSAAARLIAGILRPGSGGFRTRSQIGRRWASLAGPHLTQNPTDFRRPFIDAWRAAPRQWSSVRKSQYTDMRTALVDNLLVKVDRSTMAFGLEARVPFLDHRVVEFGLSLPDDFKIRGTTGKLLLRQWSEKYLPSAHLRRKKRGFHVPIGDLLNEDFVTRLGQKLRAHPAVRDWFLPDGVTALAAAPPSSTRNRALWSLMQFAIWHRLFIDRPGQVPAAGEDPLAWL